jgi:lysophospholipase L1-like esterase
MEGVDKSERGYLLIQFGGNDANFYEKKYPSPFKNNIDYNKDGTINDKDNNLRWQYKERDFKSALKFYIDEARNMGYEPVLITSINSRAVIDGVVKNNREPYPTWMKDLAESEGVRVLDLNKKSLEEYNKNINNLKEMYGSCKVYGNDELVHYEPRGAKIVARWIKELSCQDKKSSLCKLFK